MVGVGPTIDPRGLVISFGGDVMWVVGLVVDRAGLAQVDGGRDVTPGVGGVGV